MAATKTKNSLLSTKIAQFIAEVGDRELTQEQTKIFHAFTKTKGSVTNIKVTDSNGKVLKIKIYSDKFSNGTQHILMGHYKTNRGPVTAMEILNLCDVVRKGVSYASRGYTVYKLLRHYGKTSICTVLKINTESGDAVLKSFYSDRK